jgi:transcriptional regulator with XRE-family HTH domain
MSANGPASGPPRTPEAALASEVSAELGRQRLSDQELGRRIGVSKNTAGRIMNGLSAINARRLFRIADALGLPPEELVRRARLAMAGTPWDSPGGFNPLRGGPPPH